MKPTTLAFLILMMIPMPVAIGTDGWSSASPFIDQPLENEPDYFILETLTIYHPVAGQCDATPLVTASNARIDIEKLRRQEIRWMALSRNMLKRWDGVFHYGDTVVLNAGDPEIDGLWVVNDNMNKRFRDRGDLLFHSDTRKSGIWKNVKVAKWGSKPMATI